MDFKNWLISEMPINKFQLMGKWDDPTRRHLYDKASIGLLQNPNAVAKIHRSWSNSKQLYDFYFVKGGSAMRYRQIGEMSAEDVKNKLKLDIQPNPQAITVIFTNNVGDEKIPMTAWIIAHRLGHAVSRVKQFQDYFSEEMERDFREMLQNAYSVDVRGYSYTPEKRAILAGYVKSIGEAIGTFRSARMGNIRNSHEFMLEVFAQYIITGKIKFNPLPRAISSSYTPEARFNSYTGRYDRSRPVKVSARISQSAMDVMEFNELLQQAAEKYEHHIDSIMVGLVGKIFVM